MTTKKELYTLIDGLKETQFDHAKQALTAILQGKLVEKLPICDLGSTEDIATLYESVIYNEKCKI